MNYTVILTFRTSMGNKSSITIEKAKAELSKAEIIKIMDEIISQNIFETSKGAELKEKVSAIITEKKDTEYIF